jgi:hypothetical protein
MRTVLALAVMLGLAGCTLDLEGTKWQRPQMMAQQITAAEYECAHKAFAVGPGPDLILGGLLDVKRLAVQEWRQSKTFDDCMTALGYTQVGG